MTDTAPAPVAIRLVLSPTMAVALDRITETTGMDRTNAIRAALVFWIEQHPAWIQGFEEWTKTTEPSTSTS